MTNGRLFQASIVAFVPFLLLSQTVVSLRIDGTINPAAAGYVARGIESAKEKRASCAILELNTPGGLLKSTRVIVSSILASPIPVVVFVSPGGAHAGSAGVFITLAAHIAAMAPGTNIGAAHPVSAQGPMDSTMNEKATNDAAAFIRSIAEKRHRNLAWAEKAVTRSLSITETEALKEKVIDLIAQDLSDLLQKIDGKRVLLGRDTVAVRTTNATIERIEMSWAEKLLDILSDPNIAYILFLLGIYGLLFELYNPGAIFPGIVGVISIILAFYSMHTLPINYAGVALIVFAIILFVLEIKIVSHGLLALGGILSLVLGAMMLIRPESELEFIAISWTVIITSAGLTAFFFLFVIGLGLRAQRLQPSTGIEGLVGQVAEAATKLDPTGTVRVHGELWKAESTTGMVRAGSKVTIHSIENLTLKVQQKPKTTE
ncbi:MAG: nodulation protein NfeD [Ignavibacteriales bacterium]|nr:nodulation protein NfeD [Ignavibacteriales bacterium]